VKGRFVWRKLSGAKWEDAWVERLAFVSERLAITALAGRKTIRLEVFHLTRVEADKIWRAFGGEVVPQKPAAPAQQQAGRAPIRVRDKLVVVDRSGLPTAGEDGTRLRPTLVIPAGMAFGTGDHATTATCLRLLADVSDEFREQPWELLDLGTGTGILAIAARLLGARRVDAADFDPDAVRVAKENVKLNSVDRVTVRNLDVRSWQPARTWDVVVANLFSGLLTEAAPQIAAATSSRGRLIFSGVLRNQEVEVVAALRGAGFHVERIVRKGKWIAGKCRREDPDRQMAESVTITQAQQARRARARPAGRQAGR